jgi:hypothetical protein
MSMVRMRAGMRLGPKFLVNSKQKWFGQSKSKGGKNFQFDITGYEGHDPWHTR